jgi:hypothetical protein
VGSQAATQRSQTTSPCSPMVRLPAQLIQPPTPGTEALGPVSGTCGRVRVMVAKLSASTKILKVGEE